MGDVNAYTALVGLLLGSVSPLVTAVIQQPRWSSTTRFWVALGMAAVIGTATAFARGDLTSGLTWPATIAAVFIAAESTYRGWRAGGVVAPIENVTSLTARRGNRTGGPGGPGGQRAA